MDESPCDSLVSVWCCQCSGLRASDRCVVGSRCLPLRFPADIQCETSVYMLSCHLHTFAEGSAKVFGSFFFFPQHFEMSLHCLLAFLVSVEKSCLNLIEHHFYAVCHFSPPASTVSLVKINKFEGSLIYSMVVMINNTIVYT